MKSWLKGPRAFALAGILAFLIAGALVAATLTGSSDEQAAPEPAAALDSTETSRLLEGVPQNGTVLGRPNAPVTLVEYGGSAGAALALGAFAFSAYLLYFQLAVIDAVCDWCLVSDAIVTVLVPFMLLRLSAAGRRPAR